MKSKLYIIGCGGVGSWLTPALTLLTSPEQITLIDMDTLEEKNLDRQLFKPEDIGRSKAEALAERYRCLFRHEWFCEGIMEYQETDWFLVCVDNHRARRAALAECDRYGCRAIFAANELWSSEAYYYQPDWKETALDPRKYYPDILTDNSGDPRARGIGCTGDTQKETPQLVTANALGAALAGQLFALWHLHAPTVKKKTIPSLPFLLRSNRTRMEHKIIGEVYEPENKSNREEVRSTNSAELQPSPQGSRDMAVQV